MTNIKTHAPHQELEFREGESRQTVTLTIVDDLEPEPGESFEVVLASPKHGAVLGQHVRSQCYLFFSIILNFLMHCWNISIEFLNDT